MGNRHRKGKFNEIRKARRKEATAKDTDDTGNVTNKEKNRNANDAVAAGGDQIVIKTKKIDKFAKGQMNANQEKELLKSKAHNLKTGSTKPPVTNNNARTSRRVNVAERLNTNVNVDEFERKVLKIFNKSEKRKSPDKQELSNEICQVFSDVERMKVIFGKDPVSGKIRLNPNMRRIADGCTALQLAIKAKAPDTIKLLLDSGADVASTDFKGDNAIMTAIKEGQTSVLNTLWPYRGATDVNHADIAGRTALWLAVENRWEACVNFLLQNGADPNILAQAGDSTLMKAARVGDIKIVERLIRAGADPFIPNQDMQTCTTLAVDGNHRDVTRFIIRSLKHALRPDFLEMTMTQLEVLEPKTEYIWLLEVCTELPGFRDFFISQQVAKFLLKVLLGRATGLEGLHVAIGIFQLIFCTMFRFNVDYADNGFVCQFMHFKGPEKAVTYMQIFSDDNSKTQTVENSQSIVLFLPMLGLCVLAEGRVWIKQHSIVLSEFLKHFERDKLKVYLAAYTDLHWCISNDRFPYIDSIWKRFFDIVERAMNVQRQKNIMELLQEEEEEKMREANKKLKKQKCKPAKISESPTNEMTVVCESIFGLPEDSPTSSVKNDCKDTNLILDLFRYEPTKEAQATVCTNGNAAPRPHVPGHQTQQRIETKPYSAGTDGTTAAQMTKQVDISDILEKTPAGEDWTKVQSKKHGHKDKQTSELRHGFEQTPATDRQRVHQNKSPIKRVNKKKTQKPVTPSLAPRVMSPTVVNGHTRWADVAKGAICTPPEGQVVKPAAASTPKKESLVEKEFPSLNGTAGTSAPAKNDKITPSGDKKRPSKLLFNFYEVDAQKVSQPNAGSTTASQPPQSIETRPIGDMIEHELAQRTEQMSGECFMYDPEYVETEDDVDKNGDVGEDKHTLVRCHGGSPQQETGVQWLKELSVSEDTDVTDDISDDNDEVATDPEGEYNTDEFETDPVILLLEKNQRESIDIFEEFNTIRESDPFIALEPVPESERCCPLPNALDVLFANPGLIPHVFEEEAEHAIERDFETSDRRVPKQHLFDLPSAQLPPMPELKLEQIEIVPRDPAILGSVHMTSKPTVNAATIVSEKIQDTATNQDDEQPDQTPQVMGKHTPLMVNNSELNVVSDVCGVFQLPKPKPTNREPGLPVTNSAFGQQLLRNACRLTDQQDREEDSFLWPADLGGSPYGESATSHGQPKSDLFFPSFHDEQQTSSASFEEACSSAAKKIHDIQLQQLQLFYDQHRDEIMNFSTSVHDDFVLNAQMIGLGVDAIRKFINGEAAVSEIKHHVSKEEPNVRWVCPLPWPQSDQRRNIKVTRSVGNTADDVKYTLGKPANVVDETTVEPLQTAQKHSPSVTMVPGKSAIQRPCVQQRPQFAPLLSKPPGLVNSPSYRQSLLNTSSSSTNDKPPIYQEPAQSPMTSSQFTSAHNSKGAGSTYPVSEIEVQQSQQRLSTKVQQTATSHEETRVCASVQPTQTSFMSTKASGKQSNISEKQPTAHTMSSAQTTPETKNKKATTPPISTTWTVSTTGSTNQSTVNNVYGMNQCANLTRTTNTNIPSLLALDAPEMTSGQNCRSQTIAPKQQQRQQRQQQQQYNQQQQQQQEQQQQKQLQKQQEQHPYQKQQLQNQFQYPYQYQRQQQQYFIAGQQQQQQQQQQNQNRQQPCQNQNQYVNQQQYRNQQYRNQLQNQNQQQYQMQQNYNAVSQPQQQQQQQQSQQTGSSSDILVIQAQQAAMTQAIIQSINAVYQSMVMSARPRSLRWSAALQRLRTLPLDRLLVIDRIVIPKYDADRLYLTFHSSGASILGYLVDGTEVSVKMVTPEYIRAVRNLPTKLENLRKMDDSQEYFILKYKEYAMHEGILYVTSELHEYTLAEYFAKQVGVDNLVRQRMMFQLLRGMQRLHQDHLCVHGEIRPGNIVLDAQGTLKVTGYGIGRNCDRDAPRVVYSDEDKCWQAPEVAFNTQKSSFKSDIFVTGILLYYILSGGRHPFGSNTEEILQNLRGITPALTTLCEVGEEAADLLVTMMAPNRTERPSISMALGHPCFWGMEKRFRFVNIVGSDIVWELKHGPDGKRESMFEVLNTVNNFKIGKWTEQLEGDLLREMTGYRQYKNTLADLVLFVHNYCNHKEKLSERARACVDEPCQYFFRKFPFLFMNVYRAVKRSPKRNKTCYLPFF